jgi:hypothetical protein
MKIKAGRKPLYNVGELKVGERVHLNDDSKEFAHQYAYSFRNKFPGRNFKRVEIKGKVYVERTK